MKGDSIDPNSFLKKKVLFGTVFLILIKLPGNPADRGKSKGVIGAAQSKRNMNYHNNYSLVYI